MAKVELHPDFKDFLKLFNSHGVEYLLVGGYAVGFHGYPRATADMNVWIAVNEHNAAAAVAALRDFGIPEKEITDTLFMEKDKIIRMGVPPIRIEVLTGVSGVDFHECYGRRIEVLIDDINIYMIDMIIIYKENQKIMINLFLLIPLTLRASPLIKGGVQDLAFFFVPL